MIKFYPMNASRLELNFYSVLVGYGLIGAIVLNGDSADMRRYSLFKVSSSDRCNSFQGWLYYYYTASFSLPKINSAPPSSLVCLLF